MNKKEYETMYEKMELSDEMDRQIKNAIMKTRAVKRTGQKKYRIAIGTAAALVLLVGVGQTDVARAAMDQIARYFSYSFTVAREDGTKEQIQMKEEYITLSQDAPKKSMKMNSISEVNDAIGIHLLDSKEAYLHKGCIEYSPKVSKAGEMYGVTVSAPLYAVGDLKAVKLHEEENYLSFSAGKKYQTPMTVQISLRTDENATKEYRDNELGFVSQRMNLDLSQDSSEAYDAEVYELKSLGVKAVLYTIDTDGPIEWRIETDDLSCTNAVFVYEGVEYVYMGGVSHDTMKQFLDTLE